MRTWKTAARYAVTVAALSGLVAGCSWYDDDGGEDPPASDNDDRLVDFDEVEQHPDFRWDFERVVTVHVAFEAQALPGAGIAPVEVRHTVGDGHTIYQGRLSSQTGLERSFRTRVPQHETELTVTTLTRDGLIRRVVPIDDDGTAYAVFQ